MRVLFALIFGFAVTAAQADPYRCNVGGKAVYQEEPCFAPAPKIKPAAELQAEFERERDAKRQAATPPVKNKPVAAAPAADTSRDSMWIIQNQDSISRKLRDPDSAKFRDSFVSRKSGAPVVCGYVNGKNAFGAYPGFVRFVAAGSSIQVLEADMAAGEMGKLWESICGPI